MNITMNSQVSQVSPMTTPYTNKTLSKALETSHNKQDALSISDEGKAMGRMLKNDQSHGQRQAHKAAFQSTYSDLNMQALDGETMTDEALEEVLTSFESQMADHMPKDYKSASEMSSSEMKEALKNVQTMATKMQGAKGHYGPKKGGARPQGPKKVQEDQTQVSSGVQEDEDLLASLLEALEEDDDVEEESNVIDLYASKSMAQVMEMLSASV